MPRPTSRRSTPRACAPSSTCARTTSTGTASARRSRRRSGRPGSPSTGCPCPTGRPSRPTCSTAPSRRPRRRDHLRALPRRPRALGGGRRRPARDPVAASTIDEALARRRGPLADLPAAAVADRRRARLGRRGGSRERRMKPVARRARPPVCSQGRPAGRDMRVAKGVMVGIVVLAALATIVLVGGSGGVASRRRRTHGVRRGGACRSRSASSRSSRSSPASWPRCGSACGHCHPAENCSKLDIGGFSRSVPERVA